MEDKTYKCENCGTEVMASETKCPKCGEALKKESIFEDNEEYEEKPDIKENDIYKNINFFILMGYILKVICFLTSGVLFVVSIAESENESVLPIVFIFIPIFIIMGFVIENIFKQKAYMLYTNNEIMKKLK